ncbi:hypothetical protein JCM10908_001775 [Rhodotorula pacifica]|uniref:metallophosphoesterase family protein n=1 Tax=Rhodotorula pacifica TaxID=1495444 RepID=UPI0031798550
MQQRPYYQLRTRSTASPNRDRPRRDEEAKAGSRTPLSRSVSPSLDPGSTANGSRRPRLRRPARRRTALLYLLLILLALFLLEWATRPSRQSVTDLLYLFRFKLLDRAYTERWTSWIWWSVGLRVVSCVLRKEPIVFVRNDQGVAIVWETNTCEDDQAWQLRWRVKGTVMSEWHAALVAIETVQPPTLSNDARLVHTARLLDLDFHTRIDYELSLVSAPDGRIQRSLRHSFPWTSSASETHPETLHIACVADNQFNVRTFRRVLLTMANFARRSLSADYFVTSSLPNSQRRKVGERRPHLLLHAGDVVQDPDNLAQWQTDFWDALTRSGMPFSLGQETPVLLARGNHDWDSTGSNAYTGGSHPDDPDDHKEAKNRGTYFAYSPHRRMRILVLDSNLPTGGEQLEQERWLAEELEKPEWTEASLKVAVVHTAPWIEWWDHEAWTVGKESQWSSYVRQRLMPRLSEAGCALVLSGHSHAYTRGFIPHDLVPALSRARNSSSLSPETVSRLRSKPWLHAVSSEDQARPLEMAEPGLVVVTFGGAGGSLDRDQVEDWHVMETSISGRYHFGWMSISFAGKHGQEAEGGAVRALDQLESESHAGRLREVQVYRAKGMGRKCSTAAGEEQVRDVVEWRAVGIDGKEVDRFFLVGEGCA